MRASGAVEWEVILKGILQNVRGEAHKFFSQICKESEKFKA